MTDKKYFFVNESGVTLWDVLNFSSEKTPLFYSKMGVNKIELKYKESKIILLSDDYIDMNHLDKIILKSFYISTFDNLLILKYLFDNFNLLFYDEDYEKEIKFLNPVKDKKYYDNILNEYITDCMIHHNIIRDVFEIEEKIYADKKTFFYSSAYIDTARELQIKRIKTNIFKSRLKLLFLKIKRFFGF